MVQPDLNNELYLFLIKIGIPATIAVSISLSIKSKKEKITLKRAVLSLVVGVGCSYFLYPYIKANDASQYNGAIIGMTAILGEKVMDFLLFKFNIDNFLGAVIEAVKDFVIKVIRGKK